ncbi:hypothetical protein [Ekhidna sp.]|uniref:hypothetical protein n=1 Tax=Ekhidna sp. TaxID=2608089 RepID=UPI003BAA922E
MNTSKEALATYIRDGIEYGFFKDPEHESNEIIKRMDTMEEVGYVVDRKSINEKLKDHVPLKMEWAG